MTEEIIIDKEDKTKKHRNNEIDCLHFSCRKGESGKVLFWCGFYDDHCDNYTGCYYRKYLRLEQENKELKEANKKMYQSMHKEICEYDEELGIEKASHESDLETLDTYHSVLEEINITVKQLLKGVSSNCINNTPYLTVLSLIENKINEVL